MLFDTAIGESHFVLFGVLVLLVFVNKLVLEVNDLEECEKSI
jgi:hypothetical protein